MPGSRWSVVSGAERRRNAIRADADLQPVARPEGWIRGWYQCRRANQVVYDISSKPPATIEWE